MQQDFEYRHKLSKDEDIDPCLNHMTSFLALIEQQCIDETLMPVDKGTWLKCIQSSEALVKWKLDQIVSVKTENPSRIAYAKPTKNGEPKLHKIIGNEFVE